MNRSLELWIASMELEGEIWMRELLQKLEGKNVSIAQSIPSEGNGQGFTGTGGEDENAFPGVEEPESVRKLY